MTLGEKLKEARKQAGMSQEGLAEKLNVSRSAVAKWETDTGIPDIENLKNISRLLSVSIDYLLDNGKEIDKAVIREPISLADYGKGIKKTKKDRVVKEKYPNADIYTLLATVKLTKGERIVDNLLGWLTCAPFGIPEFLNAIKTVDNEYYLVNKGDKQFLVLVTEDFIESRELIRKQTAKRFEIGNLKFTNQGAVKN